MSYELNQIRGNEDKKNHIARVEANIRKLNSQLSAINGEIAGLSQEIIQSSPLLDKKRLPGEDKDGIEEVLIEKRQLISVLEMRAQELMEQIEEESSNLFHLQSE